MTADSPHQSVGERGIGIQNVGDSNTVIFYAGRAELSLLRKHARKAEKAGWTAGFVESNQFTEFVKLAAEWRWKTDMSVVVDYAAAFARDLRAWLEILARPESTNGQDAKILVGHSNVLLG